MKKTLMLSAVVLVAAVGCASAKPAGEISEKVAAKLAEFEATGERTSCISSTQIRSIKALDDWRFLVRATGGAYYLNETPSRCRGAARQSNRMQYVNSTSQLCRNQIITIIDNASGFTVGSCSLGSFEKLVEAPAQ